MEKEYESAISGKRRMHLALLCIAITTAGIVCLSYDEPILSKSAYTESFQNDVSEYRDKIENKESLNDNIVTRAQDISAVLESKVLEMWKGSYFQLGEDPAFEGWSKIIVMTEPRTASYMRMFDMKRFRISGISIVKYEYPTHDEQYCFKMEFTDHHPTHEHRYKARFEKNCKTIAGAVLRWLTNCRVGEESLEYANIQPLKDGRPEEWKYYWLEFRPENPSHWVARFFNRPDMVGDAEYTATIVDVTWHPQPELEYYDFIEAKVIDDQRQLQPFIFKKWKKHNALAIQKIMEYMATTNRLFNMKREVKIEGREQEKSGMTTDVVLRQNDSRVKLDLFDSQGYKIISFTKDEVVMTIDDANEDSELRIEIKKNGEVFKTTEYVDLLYTLLM